MKFIKNIPGTSFDTTISCKVLNCGVNETLGQINYVLTDKTGTLTQRAMKFHLLIIGRYSFFNQRPSLRDAREIETDAALVDMLKDQGYEGDKARNALRCLSLCHSVLFNENITWISSSPEDLEFLEFAKTYRFEYQVPEQVEKENFLIINEMDVDKRYRLLERFDFTPERRRMSVIVETEVKGKPTILLFTKGADEVLIPNLNLAASGEVEVVFKQIEKLSKKGFRLLMVTVKQIKASEWNEFHTKYLALKEKTHDIDEIYEMQATMETELALLGVVAFEELVQDKVADSLKFMRAAKIKTWIATGDKANTSLAVARNCGLIFENTVVLRFTEIDKIKESVFVDIDSQLRSVPKGVFACCLIDGPYFSQIMEFKKTNVILYEEFVDIVIRAEVAIFARLYPQQKEQIIRMIKESNPKLNTLAIGDAYNDAHMLNLADVGVAIKTHDYSAISKISDYSIGEFKLLIPLMFYFGRESYRKNSYFILYNFYKNNLMMLPQFWNGFVNFFSGFPLYDEVTFQLYHVLYTMIPIMLYALFDKAYPKNKLLFSPLMYKTGTDDFYFSKIRVLQNQVLGVVLSCFLTFTSLALFDWGTYLNGWSFGFFNYGNMCFYGCVVIVNLKIFVISNSFSIAQILMVIISIGLYACGWYYQNLSPKNDLSETFWEIIFSFQFLFFNGVLVGIVMLEYLANKLSYFQTEFKYVPDFDLKFDANAADNNRGTEPELAISGVSDNQQDQLVAKEQIIKKLAKKTSINRRKSGASAKEDNTTHDDNEKQKYEQVNDWDKDNIEDKKLI